MKTTLTHIIFKLQKIKVKQQFLKGKHNLNVAKHNMNVVKKRMTSNFSSETMKAKREWSEIFKASKKTQKPSTSTSVPCKIIL